MGRFNSRFLLVAFLISVASVVSVDITSASHMDRTADILSEARREYETAMELRRNEIGRAIMAETRKAQSGNGSADALDAALEADRLFETRGTLPDYTAADRWKRQYASIARKMMERYAQAEAAYRLNDEEQLADAVAASAALFRSHWDLVPWTIEATMAGQMIAADDDVTFNNEAIGDDFRIDVVARRKGATGSLEIEFPAMSSRARVSGVMDDAGDCRVMLTILDSAVSGDLGVVLPLALSAPDEEGGESNGVSLRAVGGDIEVVSVRVKRVVEGSPPVVEVVGGRDDEDKPQRQALTARDLMPVGSVWRGRVTHNHKGNFDTRLEVKSVTDSTIIMSGSWVAQIKLEFVFQYRGTKLKLERVRELSNTGGTRSSATGSGSVSADGNMVTTDYWWRVSGPRGGLINQVVRGTITLTRQ